MSYATVAQVKTYLDITSASDDALLSALIDRARAIIDAATRATFSVPADATRYVERRYVHDRVLWLPERWLLAQPATTIVTPGGVTVPGAAVRYAPPTAPYVSIRLIDSAYSWLDGSGDCAITGRWGWSVTPPDDIVHATVRLTAWLYRQRSAASDLDRPTVADGGLVVLPMRLPSDVEALIQRYLPVL